MINQLSYFKVKFLEDAIFIAKCAGKYVYAAHEGHVYKVYPGGRCEQLSAWTVKRMEKQSEGAE